MTGNAVAVVECGTGRHQLLVVLEPTDQGIHLIGHPLRHRGLASQHKGIDRAGALEVGHAVTEAKSTTPAHGNRDILPAVQFIAHRCRNHTAAHGSSPELFAASGVIGHQPRIGRSLKDQITGRRQRSSIPGRDMLLMPGFLLPHRVPGDQATKGQAAGLQHHAPRIPAGIAHELARRIAVEAGPVRIVGHGRGNMLGRNIGQPCLRAIGHGMPVMRPQGAGNDLGLAGAAHGLLHEGTAVAVIAPGPVHGHKVPRGDEFSALAVDHKKVAVLGRMQQYLAQLAVNSDVSLHDILGRSEVPVIARRFLVVPFVGTRVRVQRHDGAQIEVVSPRWTALAVRPG